MSFNLRDFHEFFFVPGQVWGLVLLELIWDKGEMYLNGWCICWPVSLLAQMGLLDIIFIYKLRKSMWASNFFQKRQAGI